MPKIKYLTVQITPNQVSEGFYTVDDGLLTMVRRDGKPVRLKDESTVTRALQAGDDEVFIARMLTRQIRKHFLDEKVEGFSLPLQYQNFGVA